MRKFWFALIFMGLVLAYLCYGWNGFIHTGMSAVYYRNILAWIVDVLVSAKLFFVLLLWLMVLLVAGTVAQKDMGLFAAQQVYFFSKIVWLGDVVPVPGGATVMALITFALGLKIVLQTWTLKTAGTLITHLGVLTLFIGGFVTAFYSVEGIMRIEEGESKAYMVDIESGIMPPPKTALPFAVKLLDFRVNYYPGTDMAQSYASDVVVEDGKLEWPAFIRMNQPLRYRGYTFYQSSFELGAVGEGELKNGGKDSTILQVVKNPGRLFPYIASCILCLGLLIHLVQRLPVLLKRRVV